MSNFRRTSLSKNIARTLAVFNEENRAVLIHEFRFLRGEDERQDTVQEAYIQIENGCTGADLKRWLWSNRKRNGKDMRRAFRAENLNDEGWHGQVVEQDPLAFAIAGEALFEYQKRAAAAGWASAAAPATVGQEPALRVAVAAAACHRGLRTIQTRMRSAARAELIGQGVLPGVPTAREVYLARALGGEI